MNRSGATVVAVLSVVTVLFTLPDPSWARMGSGKFAKTDVRAQLDPCCGDPEPEAEGKADRRTFSMNGTVKLDSFSANVEIPVPSSGLGISDPTTADIRLVLSRAGTDYAECFLVLEQEDDAQVAEGDDDNEGTTAEFRVKILQVVQNGSPVVKQVQGQCDVDLGTAGVQPGVPAIQAGDVGTVRVVGSSTSTDFLQGTFQPHN